MIWLLTEIFYRVLMFLTCICMAIGFLIVPKWTLQCLYTAMVYVPKRR